MCIRDRMEAEVVLHSRYPVLQPRLPAEVYFVTSGELESRYPDLTPAQREEAITKAVSYTHLYRRTASTARATGEYIFRPDTF